jgi:protein arginine kinase activator
VKCEKCNNEATVHEVTVEGGKPAERHLCEACAREVGLVAGAPVPVSEMLQKIAGGQVPGTGTAAEAVACPACGTSFQEFKQTGRLGCPECYRALEKPLAPILDRAHQGAVHHVGKVPQRLMRESGPAGVIGDREVALAAAEARVEQIRRVRDDLERAVKSEAYERAAGLRDRLQKLLRGVESPGGSL